MGRRALVTDILLPIAAVGGLAVLVILASGTWPPLVAVESGSMAPNAVEGDMIVLSAPTRFVGPGADDVGVVTAETARATAEGEPYRRLGGPGDVLVFRPPGWSGSPIFHRAAFAVEAGENWYDRADRRYHDAIDCQALRHCPAPHAGYITIGDNNTRYDQADGIAPPVRSEWVAGKAQLRVPLIGWLRLGFEAGVDALTSVLASKAGPTTSPTKSIAAASEPNAAASGPTVALAGSPATVTPRG